MRDCVNCLKLYLSRCPIEKKPSSLRLISIFLESLNNKTVHDHPYARRHVRFQECCLNVMDFDDNFEAMTKLVNASLNSSSSKRSSVRKDTPTHIEEAKLME